MYLGSRLDFILLNGAIWGGQLLTASLTICYYCAGSEQQAAVCMPHLTNDSLSITIALLWDHNLSFSCFILKR